MASFDESLPNQTHEPIGISIIDLVLAATESSEDEGEINDGIAALIQTRTVRILRRRDDPMLRREQAIFPTGEALALPTPQPLTR